MRMVKPMNKEKRIISLLNYYSISEVADILGKSTETLRRWDREGKLSAVREPISNYRIYKKDHYATTE